MTEPTTTEPADDSVEVVYVQAKLRKLRILFGPCYNDDLTYCWGNYWDNSILITVGYYMRMICLGPRYPDSEEILSFGWR